jgi:hypothetical protein
MDDEDFDPVCSVNTLCDYTLQFDTLDAIQAASSAGTIDDVCVSFYTLHTLSTMINEEMSNYTSVNSGYDGLFKYYTEYVKNMVPDALSSFMAIATLHSPNGGAGQAYFDCTYTRKSPASLATSFTQACPIPVSGVARGYFHEGIILTSIRSGHIFPLQAPSVSPTRLETLMVSTTHCLLRMVSTNHGSPS